MMSCGVAMQPSSQSFMAWKFYRNGSIALAALKMVSIWATAACVKSGAAAGNEGLETCAECDEYVCEELEKVYTVMSEVFGKAQNGVAEAKINLDSIRSKQKAAK